MTAKKTKDIFSKKWIIENAIQICSEYEKGILTLRALHYQLVSIGMTNDIQHYKRVVNAMIEARWNKQIDFDTFSDLDRSMVGNTDYKETILNDEIYIAKHQINNWMTSYKKNRWENQTYYPEVFIEKKALQGVFNKICDEWNVALGACKGYPSLTFLNEAYIRFRNAQREGKVPVIIYFGDYDPSGEDIPRSIQDNIEKFGCCVEIKRIALLEHQVIEWKLPPAPAKETDTRTANWNGLGQVELDAVKPNILIKMCRDAIEEHFDYDKYDELLSIENEERLVYVQELKEHVSNLNL